jgi:hypothetical protein
MIAVPNTVTSIAEDARYNEKKVVCPTILFLLGCLMIMTLESDQDIFDRERDENAKEYGAAAN